MVYLANILVLIDPGTYIYYNATMQRNKEAPQQYPGEYSTDVVASKATAFLEEAMGSSNPFFIAITPIGPHGQTTFTSNYAVFDPPVPADRHKDMFPGLKVPRTYNFNPETVCIRAFCLRNFSI